MTQNIDQLDVFIKGYKPTSDLVTKIMNYPVSIETFYILLGITTLAVGFLISQLVAQDKGIEYSGTFSFVVPLVVANWVVVRTSCIKQLQNIEQPPVTSKKYIYLKIMK